MREEQLRYILEIAHVGSINKAADSLFLSHQSLERSLRNFENDLGVKIFARTKKGVEPTELGKTVLEKVQELVFGYDELRVLAQNNVDCDTDFLRTFTIYAESYIRYPLINLALQRLTLAFPNVKFQAKICRGLEQIQSDEFYLLLATDHSKLQEINTTQYDCQEFFADKTHLIVSISHPLAKYREISVRAALQYPFVIMQPEGALPNPMQLWCEEKKLRMVCGLETDHLHTYIHAICGGNMVGCWPEMALTMPELRNHKELKVVALKDIPCFYVYGLMERDSYEKNEDIVQQLLQSIRSKDTIFNG